MKIILLLIQSRIYWGIKKSINQISFFIKKNLYRGQHKFQDKSSSIFTFIEIIKITLLTIIISFIVVYILVIVEPFLSNLISSLKLSIPDDSDYITLFATIAGIGGVFIGLYYTAISTVSGAIYARVPNNIRDLLQREKIGNVYMQFLAFTTFLSLNIIGLRVLFGYRLFGAVIIIVILSGIGIIAFVRLGQRAFNFFDPTSLSSTLFYDLRKQLNSVTAGSFEWDNMSFQSHTNKLARATINNLETLSSITREEPHLKGRPFTDLSKYLVGFLYIYQAKKKNIPLNSHWYNLIYTHKNWYKTDTTHLDIASRTGTQLQPNQEFDEWWIEKRLVKILTDCVITNIKSGNDDLVIELLNNYTEVLYSISRNGELKQAFILLNELEQHISKLILERDNDNIRINEKLILIGYWEIITTSLINICLEYIRVFSKVDREHLLKSIKKITWESKANIYRNDFHPFILKEIEELYNLLHFEIKVEGKVISPHWYLLEIISLHYSNKLVDNITFLTDDIFEYYSKTIEKLNESKMYYLSACVLSREWEYYNKLLRNVDTIVNTYKDLYEKNVISGLKWSTLDLANIEKKLATYEKTIFKAMSKLNILLSTKDRHKELPDYQGQFLHSIAERLVIALCNNEEDIFLSLFYSYFYGSIDKYEELRPIENKIDWRVEQKYKIAAAPILDLIEICGYTFLISEFNCNDKLWITVTETWDKFIEEQKSESPLTLFSVLIELTENAIEIPYRGIIRTNWEQMIFRKFAELKKIPVMDKYSLFPREKIDHPSALVRLIGGERYLSMFDGISIFSAFYFMKHGKGIKLKFGRKSEQLIKSVELHKKENENEDD